MGGSGLVRREWKRGRSRSSDFHAFTTKMKTHFKDDEVIWAGFKIYETQESISLVLKTILLVYSL